MDSQQFKRLPMDPTGFCMAPYNTDGFHAYLAETKTGLQCREPIHPSEACLAKFPKLFPESVCKLFGKYQTGQSTCKIKLKP